MPIRDTLLPVIKQYFDDDPARAARRLEAHTDARVAEVLRQLPVATAAEVFRHFQAAFAAAVMQKLNPETFRDLFGKLDPQQGFSLFLNLAAEDRQRFLDSIHADLKKQIQELLTFPEESAGRLMKPDFIAFLPETKAREAVHRLRQSAKKQAPASYVYVVDPEKHLIGIINMRDLMLAASDVSLGEIMRKELYSVNAFTDREVIAQELSRRNFISVPVVDAENRLLGILKAEEVLKGVQEEATEDIQKMFGAGGDERPFSPVSYKLKMRLPWLHVNLVTAFMAAWVVSLFEGIIAKITVLAVFLPVVAGQGGNAGAQSLAVVMRGLVMREITGKKGRQVVFKEAGIGAVNGLIIGLVTALAAWAWQGNPFLGVVIGLGMLVNLSVAGFSGAAIPLAMKKAGLDPAQCSNIILTTVTDVMGFLAFLGFAVIFQQYLV